LSTKNPIIAGSRRFRIVPGHATDPEVAVAVGDDIMEVIEEVMADMTDVLDAADDAVEEDELLELVGFELAASG